MSYGTSAQEIFLCLFRKSWKAENIKEVRHRVFMLHKNIIKKKIPPLFPYFPVYTSDMFTHPYYLLLTTYESQILRHPLMSFACSLIAMMQQHYD